MNRTHRADGILGVIAVAEAISSVSVVSKS